MTDHASKPRHDLNSLFPLADHMRPDRISEVYGQEHLTGPGKILADMVAREQLGSIILWGPPGTGKTTISRILAKSLNCLLYTSDAADE